MSRLNRFAWVAFAIFTYATFARSQELKPLYYESFDSGKLPGKVGNAGPGVSVDARGKIDLERGTIAFFTYSAKAPVISEWSRFGGLNADRDGAYWGMLMGFDNRKEDFIFNLYDIGRYAPPLKLSSNLGRWKAEEWHHLAAVWDRNQGVTVYEDGKRVNSNWGKHQWEWNLFPLTLFFQGTVDEAYVFSETLTDAQVVDLAQGKKPTGAPLPPLAAEKTRANDLARYGWQGDSLAALPIADAGKPLAITFAPIVGAVDSKRPVAQPYDGDTRSPWPLDKYGASIQGARLDMDLEPQGNYDRARIFIHRNFKGNIVEPTADGAEHHLATIDEPRATFWNRKFDAPTSAKHLVLKRTTGALGDITFYRSDPAAILPPAGSLVTYALAKAPAFPDTELGKSIQSEVPIAFQVPVNGTIASSAASTIETPAFGGFQVSTEPPKDAKAFDGAVVTLVAEGITQPTPVRVQIREPIDSTHDWLAADVVLKPSGAGKQVFTLLIKGRPVINFPPTQSRKYLKDGQYSDEMIPNPGTAFGVLITAANPVKWTFGPDGSSVAFVQTDLEKAKPVVVLYQEEMMRSGYSEVMEGHAYADRMIVTPLKWLTMFAPERMKVQQMYERCGTPKFYEGLNVPKLVWKETANTSGAPDWAYWQMQAMNECLRIVHWYIDNAQLENGEYGGVWNDDTDHIENWFDWALCADDDGKIKASIRKFIDGDYNTHLDRGVGKYAQDILHFVEEGVATVSMQNLIDYGDPTAFNRLMAASSHYDKWLKKDDKGRYSRISEYVTANGAWTEREFGGSFGYGSHLLVPAGYMLWYNNHPEMIKYFKGWTGQELFHGAAIGRAEGLAAARKQMAQDVLKPVSRYGALDHICWVDEIGMNDEIRRTFAKPYEPLPPIQHYVSYTHTIEHWWAWQTSGDIRYLTDSYKRVCEWTYSHDWLNSGAMPSMDRNPLPRTTVVRARMGAQAANRSCSQLVWPLHGLSYVKGGNEVAALVMENVDTKLTARFYSFLDKPHDMQMRVWRLNPGTYKVALANDKNDDGVGEDKIFEKEMTLDRGAYLDLTLPPRQCCVLTITPIKTTEPNYDKPDPAIGPNADSVDYVYGEHLVVRVYNQGTKPVDNLLVRVRDRRSGEVVLSGEQTIDHIDPPLDLQPKWKAVEFKNINANTYGGFIVEIDPENKIDDLNRYNNRVVVGD